MEKKNNFNILYAISVASQLGFLITVPIVGFLLLGHWIDKRMGTKQLFLIIGLLVGFIVTVYEVYQVVIPLIKKEK